MEAGFVTLSCSATTGAVALWSSLAKTVVSARESKVKLNSDCGEEVTLAIAPPRGIARAILTEACSCLAFLMVLKEIEYCASCRRARGRTAAGEANADTLFSAHARKMML